MLLETPAYAIICTVHDVISLAKPSKPNIAAPNRHTIDCQAWNRCVKTEKLFSTKKISGIGIAFMLEDALYWRWGDGLAVLCEGV